MRKVSKSRVDDADDVVSSTNGSVNDDQPDEDKQAGGGADSDSNPKTRDSDDTDFDGKDDEPLNSSKSKKKGKGRPKKGKSKRSSKAEKNADNDKEEEEYEVEKIIDSKKIKGRVHFLIRWKGYSASSDSWEPENTLSCPELINKFNEEHQNNSTNKEKGSSKPAKGKKRKADKKESKTSPAKRTKTEWDSENADENAEYEVERILEVHHKKNGKREFLIHWKGWSNKFDSWEPEENLNCQELIKKFMEKVSAAKTSEGRSLRVAPGSTNRFTLQDPSSGRRLSKRRGQRQRVRYDDAE